MDPKGSWWLAVGAVVVLVIAGAFIYSAKKQSLTSGPNPSPAIVEQLPKEKQPQAELAFTPDGHEVTVSLTNLHADVLEYTLEYTANIKKGKEVTQLQTGVVGGGDIAGKSTFSEKQLLGSESSGKRVYHEDIHEASMKLTLRDSLGRSIFTATYPFEVKPGNTVSL